MSDELTGGETLVELYCTTELIAMHTVDAADGDVLRVEVRDHGIGFPPDQIRRIGERFFRADNAKAQQGTGLGLHIVNTIAARHGGRLEVRNAPDGGAEVTLSVRIT